MTTEHDRYESVQYIHTVLTYIEYRAVSCVFRTIDPPRRPGGEGVNISEDARHWIGLLRYNPSTYISLG